MKISTIVLGIYLITGGEEPKLMFEVPYSSWNECQKVKAYFTDIARADPVLKVYLIQGACYNPNVVKRGY